MTGNTRSLALDVAAGGLIALLSANFSLSYSALLFAGTAPATQAQGLAMLLTGSIVGSLVGARLVSLPFSVFFADGALIALLATVTSSIVAGMHGAPAGSVAATLVATLLVASLATGASLWLIGRWHAGRIVRFIPFQVTAGVLAAGGWALSMGGAAVAMNRPVALDVLADQAALIKLASAVSLALAMLVLTARFRRSYTLILIIIAGVLSYHGLMLALGRSLVEQRAEGWLVGLPPRIRLMPPWSPATLAQVDWAVVAGHAGDLLALIPLASICLLLGISGIETATGLDADINRDLRANGAAVFACGALGGVFGITSVSRSLLAYNMGVRGRRAGVIAGVGGGLLPLLLPSLLGMMPRFVLGALLLFAGLGKLQQWIARTRRRLTWSEWLTALAVLAASARFGMVTGTFAGLLLGCIAFAVIYSRGSPIRARYRGDAAQAQVDRSPAEVASLAAKADALLVLHLQGFMFFGTGSRLVDEVRREIASPAGALEHLILDFSHVDGVDGSAFASFERLQRIVAGEGIALAFAAMPPIVAARLAGLTRSPGLELHVTPTLDAALQWRETAALAGVAAAPPASVMFALRSEFERQADADTFQAVLEQVDVPADTVIMRQGDLSDDLLFIESGRAGVSTSFLDQAPIRVRTLMAGAMVGEIGFCLGLPRTATVTTDEACRVLRLTRAALSRLEREQPAVALAFQRAVLRRLGSRILDKDKLISALVLDRPRVQAPA